MNEQLEGNVPKVREYLQRRLTEKFGGGLADGYMGEIEYIGDYSLAEKLLSREKPRIDEALVTKLGEFSDEATYHPTVFIAQAREELQAFFTPRKHLLNTYGFGLVLYGSLQYGDPKNCDVDLTAFSNTDISEDGSQNLEHMINHELILYWESLSLFNGKTRGEPQLSGPTELSEYGDPTRLLRVHPGAAYDLAKALTGVSLFKEDRGWHEELKAKIRPIIDSDPFYCLLTNMLLRETLDVRLERRGMKSDLP